MSFILVFPGLKIQPVTHLVNIKNITVVRVSYRSSVSGDALRAPELYGFD